MLGWADRTQRRHVVLAFPYAVVRKYSDDEGGRDAALIAYYGFLSVFPLLLLGVAVVSRALVGDAELRQRVVDAIVPETLRSTVDDALASLPTSTLAFTVGLVGLLVSATGVVYTVDRALNHIAAVPRWARAGFVVRLVRAVVTVAVLLAGVVAVGVLTVAVAAVPGLPLTGRVLGMLGTTLVVFGVLLACGRMLLDRPAPLRSLWPAAVVGAAAVTAVLNVGAVLLTVLVTGAGPVYGGFATVAGIFTLLTLISRVLVYAAEASAVHHARLWPRAMDPTRPTEADARALALLCREQAPADGLRVDVSVPAADEPADRPGVAGEHLPGDGGGEERERQHVQPADVREREADRPVPLDADVHGARQHD
jgi:membrane protein